MLPLHRLSVIEQVAVHIRSGIATNLWKGRLPGVRRLASELGVSKDTLSSALHQLESEGLLQSSGERRCWAISAKAEASMEKRSLRIGVLLYDALDDENSTFLQSLLLLRHGIEAAGHVCVFSPKSQTEMKHSMPRITKMVAAIRADAWIVVTGSKEVLQWFVKEGTPVFGCGGQFQGLPVAASSNNIAPAIGEVTRQLLSLGHRRIVFIVPEVVRHSATSLQIASFVEAMQEYGVSVGGYHVPEWEETHQGFLSLVEGLFQMTPPTAIIVSEPGQVVCIMTYLARRGWYVPRDLSLVSIVGSSDLAMCQPRIAHLQMHHEALTRDMLRWVEGVAKNHPHRKQFHYAASFVTSESVGSPREKI